MVGWAVTLQRWPGTSLRGSGSEVLVPLLDDPEVGAPEREHGVLFLCDTEGDALKLVSADIPYLNECARKAIKVTTLKFPHSDELQLQPVGILINVLSRSNTQAVRRCLAVREEHDESVRRS